MSAGFETPVFEVNLKQENVSITDTPYFYNDGGKPSYLSTVPTGATLLPAAATDPAIAMGYEHIVPDIIGTKDNGQYGFETQLALHGDRIGYQPLWATPATAAAFGITLVQPGQAVQLESPQQILQQVEYQYGVFAGHWSPYQNTGNRLLSVVCTDLEHHDFPHIFASTDAEFPLVISVGRYWPQLSKIRLADLWVKRGDALYIPPKPNDPSLACIDMHNNRNSAHAAWGDIEADSVKTHTLLQQTGGYFYWFWNAKPTVHDHI